VGVRSARRGNQTIKKNTNKKGMGKGSFQSLLQERSFSHTEKRNGVGEIEVSNSTQQQDRGGDSRLAVSFLLREELRPRLCNKKVSFQGLSSSIKRHEMKNARKPEKGGKTKSLSVGGLINI